MTRAKRERREIERRIRQRFEQDAEPIFAGKERRRSLDRRTFVLGTTAFTTAIVATC